MNGPISAHSFGQRSGGSPRPLSLRRRLQSLLYISRLARDENSSHSEQPEVEVPKSVVFLKTVKGTRYQLTFRATNPEFSVIYYHKRKSYNETQKAVQTDSQHYFVERRDVKEVDYVLRRKEYRIIDDPSSNEVLVFLNADKNGFSEMRSEMEESMETKVYVQRAGLLFLLQTNHVTVDIARPLHEEIDETSRKAVYSNERNRASILARVDKDLVRVKFDLCEVDCQPVSVSVSRGCQVEDRFAYFRMCLTTTGAYVYCPVPLSTYIYVDPMKAIKRDNQVRQRSGLPPVWLPAERQKRIKLARHGLSLGLGPGSVSASGSGQSLGEPFDLARELAMETAALSIFAFAMNGHLVKLRSGCLVGSYEGDEEAYEEFALAHIRDRRDITVVKVGTPVDFSLAR